MKKRSNFNNFGEILQFNNGNINLRFSEKIDMAEAFFRAVELLDMIDCYVVGEEYCLSNFDIGVDIYNAHDDLIYIFAFNNITRLAEGGTVKLYANKLDTADREKLENWGW